MPQLYKGFTDSVGNGGIIEKVDANGAIWSFGDNDSPLITAKYGKEYSPGLLAGKTTQTVFEISATANYPLGTKVKFPDRREFIYCKAGGVELAPALMCQAPVQVANYTEQVQTAYGWSKGATTGTILITTGATPAANAWAEGYMIVNKGTGLGQAYRIKSNTSHATIPTVVLYDPIVTAFAATSEITIVASPFNGTIVAPATTLTGIPVGVPLLTVTLGYYYWSQVKGPCAMTVDTGDTVVIGEPVGSAGTNAVAGAIGVGVTTEGHYGRLMSLNVADETALVWLDLGL